MKYILLILIFITSCSISKSHFTEQIKLLKKLSTPIARNRTTNIYTINYEKLATPSNFEQIKEKYKDLPLMQPYNLTVKFMNYKESFEKSSLILKGISVTDIRKYFGKETRISMQLNKKLSGLIYHFNRLSESDCFLPGVGFSDYDGCAQLTFVLDEEEKLLRINLNDFYY